MPRAKDVAQFLVHLARPTRRSAIRAVVDGVVVVFRLKRRDVRSLFAVTPGRATVLDAERSTHVSAAVDAGLSLIPVAPTCLRRSVTLARELNRLGLTSTLHVGVRSVDGRVEAHAWVQAGDAVVNDDASVTVDYSELMAGQLDTFWPLLR